MTYTPIKISRKTKGNSTSGTMPVLGMDLKDDSQLLDTRRALKIENYLVYGVAKMQKRPGMTADLSTGDNQTISLNDNFRNDFDIIGYGSKIRAYNTVSKTFTDIKTDFTANSVWTGGRYGDYFFVNNINDGLWRIARTLAYDAQTVSFTVGTKVTGVTSQATGMILENSNSGTTGTLTLGSITGEFIDNEIITDWSGGSATSNGGLVFGITQEINAPKARVFRVVDKKALLVNLASNSAGYAYSETDIGTNPPFHSWSSGTAYTDPGSGANRNGMDCRDATLIGDIMFIGQEKGWFAFKITATDIAGVTGKVDQWVSFSKNFPVFRCVMTNIGMIVASNSGIWRLVSLGQPNIPYSEQWELLTEDLGPNYFDDVNFDHVDIMHDPVKGFIFVTLAKGGSANNTVLAISCSVSGNESSVKVGASSYFTGWNILSFMQEGQNVYGTSSLKGERYNLFVGQKDIEAKIHTEYLQELNIGLTNVFNLEEFRAGGDLSPSSEINVSFDTFDEKNYYEARRWIKTWKVRNVYLKNNSGWGQSGFGSTGWGGGSIASGLIPDVTGANVKLRQLTRTYLRFESDDFADHVLRWFVANSTTIKQVRVRTLN